MEGKAEFITDLPTPILHHILSYLSYEDSVRTSVLSKQWNFVQKSFPILVFKPPIRRYGMSSEQFNERIREYLQTVDRSLKFFVQNKLSIMKMDLLVSRVEQGSIPLVDTWLPLALHNGVSDLRFCSTNCINVDGSIFFRLHETTFIVNSSSLPCCSSGFFLLKKLKLFGVCLTEKIILDIIRNCLNLQDLRLEDFSGLKHLHIPKPKKLVSLTISDSPTPLDIMVDAPSLQHFKFHDLRISGEIDLTSCSNLREFFLSLINITDAQFNMNIARFPLLEVLEIEGCITLGRIRISLQRLKSLELRCVSVNTIEINAPVLSKFVCTSSELPAWVLTDASPGVLHLSYVVSQNVGSLWFFKIRRYLSVPFKDINLYLQNTYSLMGVRFNLDELRGYVIPPLVEIGCLDLTNFNLKRSSDWEALLDGLLWSCHPKKIFRYTFRYDNEDDNCIKTLRGMLAKSECKLCSNFSHCKCWRSRFKAAKIFHELTVAGCLTVRFDWENPTDLVLSKLQVLST